MGNEISQAHQKLTTVRSSYLLKHKKTVSNSLELLCRKFSQVQPTNLHFSSTKGKQDRCDSDRYHFQFSDTPKVHSRSPDPAHYKAHPLSLYPVLLYSSFQFVLLQIRSFSEPPGLFGSKARKAITIFQWDKAINLSCV